VYFICIIGEKRVYDIRSGRTGNGFGRGMTKYNGQRRKES
jgi:hypothetical protein